jgi:two-component system, NarL family, nitrate/nitrite response regulator NarL
MTRRIRVLLADDHAAVRSTVRADLDEAGFDVCAEASDAESALEAALGEQPDICLLDIRMPGNGLFAAWDITSHLPHTKVVMLTMSKSEDHMVAALRAGAVGYILKDVEGCHLAAQIHSFLRGDVTMTATLADRLLVHVPSEGGAGRKLLRRKPTDNGDAGLQRDREILEYLRDGLSREAVASRLGRSVADVRSELVEALGRVRYPDRGSIAALSSLNA